MRQFQSANEQMIIGGMKATDLADRFGTPVYVTEEARLRENFRRINDAFNKRMPTRVHFACKANANLAIMRVLEQEGSCIDAVSLGEAELALKAGYSPDRILYTGTSVSNEEMRQLVQRKVPINVDSPSQLRRLAQIAPRLPHLHARQPRRGGGPPSPCRHRQEDHQVRHPQRRHRERLRRGIGLRIQTLWIALPHRGGGAGGGPLHRGDRRHDRDRQRGPGRARPEAGGAGPGRGHRHPLQAERA